MHLFSRQHDLQGSVSIERGENGPGQSCLYLRDQRANEDPLRGLRRITIARTGTLKSAGIADVRPVGGTIDRAMEIAGINKGLQQQQRITESLLSLPRQTPFAQGYNTGGKVRMMLLWQDYDCMDAGGRATQKQLPRKRLLLAIRSKRSY